jgi:hypothetical protein
MMTTWIERHSVNCYFCGDLVDERECAAADAYNGEDGGDICPRCQERRVSISNRYEELSQPQRRLVDLFINALASGNPDCLKALGELRALAGDGD